VAPIPTAGPLTARSRASCASKQSVALTLPIVNIAGVSVSPSRIAAHPSDQLGAEMVPSPVAQAPLGSLARWIAASSPGRMPPRVASARAITVRATLPCALTRQLCSGCVPVEMSPRINHSYETISSKALQSTF
jgi:hypothetical protein